MDNGENVGTGQQVPLKADYYCAGVSSVWYLVSGIWYLVSSI